MEEQVLASNALAQDATMEERVLASNALAGDVTIEGSGYWQAMRWHKVR
jgi:hypothetical protein